MAHTSAATTPRPEKRGGIIWSGKYFQVGAEAVIPINSRTGNDVGFIAQLHFYLDDLFPHSLGRPLFGGNK